MSATVRKNFVFKEETAIHLAELAKENGQSMTSLVEEMIEERYRRKKVSKRLEAFKKFAGSSTGSIGSETIQSIKAQMHV